MAIKPATAVELVGRYARLTHAIKACKGRIGAELDKCPGLKGKRLERAVEPGFDGGPMVGWIDPIEIITEAAQADQDTHLSVWYSKDYGEWEGRSEPHFVRFTIGEGDEPDDCPACYAAHLIVQERKALRRSLASVKAAMTRHGAAIKATKPKTTNQTENV